MVVDAKDPSRAQAGPLLSLEVLAALETLQAAAEAGGLSPAAQVELYASLAATTREAGGQALYLCRAGAGAHPAKVVPVVLPGLRAMGAGRPAVASVAFCHDCAGADAFGEPDTFAAENVEELEQANSEPAGRAGAERHQERAGGRP